MEKYTLEQLAEKAAEVFEANPEAGKLFATNDGNFFLPENENAANLHASTNGGLTVHVIENGEVRMENGEISESEDDDASLLSDTPAHELRSEKTEGSSEEEAKAPSPELRSEKAEESTKEAAIVPAPEAEVTTPKKAKK